MSQLQGYVAHVINTGAEWVVAGMMLIFFLTYFTEFRSISVAIGVRFKENNVYPHVTANNDRIN